MIAYIHSHVIGGRLRHWRLESNQSDFQNMFIIIAALKLGLTYEKVD